MRELSIPTGEVDFSGPIALSIVTGKSSNKFARWLWRGGYMLKTDMQEYLNELGISSSVRESKPTVNDWCKAGFPQSEASKRFTMRQMVKYLNTAEGLYILSLKNKSGKWHYAVYDARKKMIADNGDVFGREATSINDHNLSRVVDSYIEIAQ